MVNLKHIKCGRYSNFFGVNVGKCYIRLMVPSALYINLVTDIRSNILCFFIVTTNPDLCIFDCYVPGYGNDHESVFIDFRAILIALVIDGNLDAPAGIGPLFCVCVDFNRFSFRVRRQGHLRQYGKKHRQRHYNG